MIDAWYSQDAGTLGSGAAGNGGGEASGGLPDGELLRLGEDAVGVLAVLDEVDLEARACLPALAGRVHGDLRTWVILARVWDVSLDELIAPIWE